MSHNRGGVLQVQGLLAKWSSKKADAESGGPSSTHPTANADDKTVPESENEKKPSAENSAVLKEDNPMGPNEKVSKKLQAAVDVSRKIAGLPAKKAEEPNTNVGASSSGDKPEAETPSVEDKGNDTGTSHPAHIDNPELGGKYSSLRQASADLEKLAEKIAADIVALASNPSMIPAEKSAAAPSPEAQARFAEGKRAAAEIFDDPRAVSLAKLAEESATLGHLTADYYDSLRNKKANMDPAAMAGGGGGAPPAPAPGGDPMAAMAGGGDPMAGGAGGGGGDPELAALGINSPEELAQIVGMLEQGGAPVTADGQGDEAELMALLQQMGITTPEQLEQLIAALEGGGEGGAPAEGAPPGGAPPAEGAPPAPEAAPSGSSATGGESAGGEPKAEKSEGESESEKEAAVKTPSSDDNLRKISGILRERLARGSAA